MSWKNEVAELRRRRKLAEQMGGPEKVARQHARGKLDARARIKGLVDPGSFREIGKIAGSVPFRTGNLLGNFQEVGKEDNVSIDVSQQRALVGQATQLEDAADEGRAKLVDGNIRQMPKAVLRGRFRDALVGTDQDDFNCLAKRFPASERVALNSSNVRVGERLGSREQGQSGRHQA